MEQIVIETYFGATLFCKWENVDSGFKITEVDFPSELLSIDGFASNKAEMLDKLSELLNTSDNFNYSGDDFSIVYYKPTFSLDIDPDSYCEPELMLTLNCHSDLARQVELKDLWNGGEPEDFEEGSQTYKLDRGAIFNTLSVLVSFGFEEV